MGKQFLHPLRRNGRVASAGPANELFPQRRQGRASLEPTYRLSQFRVWFFAEFGAHILQKMVVTNQIRHVGNYGLFGLPDGLTQVAHDGHRRANTLDASLQQLTDFADVLGSHFRRLEGPGSGSRHDGEQDVGSRLAGAIHVHRVAAVLFQLSTQGRKPGLMGGGQAVEKRVGQQADG